MARWRRQRRGVRVSLFTRHFDELLGIEGGFSDHPDDLGGETRFGVTEALARKYGYQGPMFNLPLERAREIARAEFWDPLRLDEVGDVNERVAFEVLDIGYNMGPQRAAVYLQRSLNALNRQQRDYPDLRVDGALGPVTLMRLRAYVEIRGSVGARVLVRALNALQGARYIELAEARERHEAFVFGWLLHRVPLAVGM